MSLTGRMTTSSVQSMRGHYRLGGRPTAGRSVRPAATATTGGDDDRRDSQDDTDNDAHQKHLIVDGRRRLGRGLNLGGRRIGWGGSGPLWSRRRRAGPLNSLGRVSLLEGNGYQGGPRSLVLVRQ